MRRVTVRSRLAAIALPLLLIAASGCDIAMADLKEKQTAEWRKSYDLEPGGRVSITNVNGKINVEPSAGPRVEVVAEKSAKGASVDSAKQALERIEIHDTATPSEITIETKLQGGGGFLNGGSLEVQFTVRVPAGAEVKFSTVNGGIELTGLKNRITAETTNGGVKARDIAGGIHASSTNGGVEVDLAEVVEPGVTLECTNGGIQIRLPRDAKATIAARIVNGGIDTGGLQFDTTPTDQSRRRLDARLNGGGPRIRLEGTNGGIEIKAR